MISVKIIHSSLQDLKKITKADFAFCDRQGRVLTMTYEEMPVTETVVKDFQNSPADSQNVRDVGFQKLEYDGEPYVLLVSASSEDSYKWGRIAASSILHLMEAGNNRMDKEDYYRRLLMEENLSEDFYHKASKMKISSDIRRCVYLIEMQKTFSGQAETILKNLFADGKDDYILKGNDKQLILIKSLASKKEDKQITDDVAKQIVSMINTEVMESVRVTYGRISDTLAGLAKAYREAKMAMEVVKVFYSERETASYTSLGIGRLIHQIPMELCELFLEEVFGERTLPELEEEERSIIEKFFKNNLNISETARELYMHRNTLVYKLERLQKLTGLDIRKFDDALTLKIAMMVAGYVQYRKDV